MQTVADYEITEELGEDGIFRYYRATPPDRLKQSSSVRLRLLKRQIGEAAISRLSKHLGIIRNANEEKFLRDIEVIQDANVMAISGEDSMLGTLADPAPDLDRTDVLRIVAEALQSLDELHQLGITHNDIRPQNIRLDSDRAKLSNPGVLQIINQGQTLPGTHSQIPVEYTHPDLVRGRLPDRKTDLWAMGVTLHRALSGNSVFPQAPTTSLLNTLRHMQIQGPTLSPSLTPEEQEIITRMLGINGTEMSAVDTLVDLIEKAAASLETENDDVEA